MDLDEREEGEMSDDSMSVDEYPPSTLSSKPIIDSGVKLDFLLEDLPGVTTIKLEKVDIAVLEEKAKELGILLAIGQKDIDDLYENIGVDAIERHIQFDTIHLKGVETMNKNDIFLYLKDYEPVTVEKITESSCNITFKDHIAACLAILVHSQDIVEEKVKLQIKSSGNHYWREGLPHPNCKLILIRFATKSDVIACTKESRGKIILNKKYHPDGYTKNPWGELCMSWGINDHQEVYGPKLPPTSYVKTDAGIIRLNHQIPYDVSLRPCLISRNLVKRLGKRHINISSDEESGSDDQWKIKSKVPRMRMRADDEEGKKKPQNFGDKQDVDDVYPSLSIQIDNIIDGDTCYNPDKTPLSYKFSKRLQSKSKVNKPAITPQKRKPSVHSRLGLRVEQTDNPNSDGELSEDSVCSYKETHQTHVMSRVHKVPTKITLQSVWTRLKKPDVKKQSMETNTIKFSGHSDLRKKLKENRRSPLRVEIDNEYYESD